MRTVLATRPPFDGIEGYHKFIPRLGNYFPRVPQILDVNGILWFKLEELCACASLTSQELSCSQDILPWIILRHIKSNTYGKDFDMRATFISYLGLMRIIEKREELPDDLFNARVYYHRFLKNNEIPPCEEIKLSCIQNEYCICPNCLL